MDIRPYEVTDRAACVAICEAVGAGRVEFEAFLDGVGEIPYFVMEHEGAVVGCGGFTVSGVVGMRMRAWQWLTWSFESPNFSEPKSSAVGAAHCARMAAAAAGRPSRGCCNSRFPTAVVPRTRAQSATASATVGNTRADWSTGAPPTAETASRKATS